MLRIPRDGLWDLRAAVAVSCAANITFSLSSSCERQHSEVQRCRHAVIGGRERESRPKEADGERSGIFSPPTASHEAGGRNPPRVCVCAQLKTSAVRIQVCVRFEGPINMLGLI